MRGGRINFWVNEQHLKSPEGPDPFSTSDGAVVPLIFFFYYFVIFTLRKERPVAVMKDLCSSEWAACSLQAHWISECHYLYLQGALLGFVLCTRRQTPLSSSGAGNVTDPWQHRRDHCGKGQTRPVVHKFTLVLCCCPSALLKCDFLRFCVIFLCYVMTMDGFELCSN